MSNLRSSVLQGVAWTTGMRWTIRALGFVNIAILARLLGPADFGLIAMATMVIGLIEVWLSLGVTNAVIQNQSADRDLFDSAWTIRIIQGCLVAALVSLAAPFAAAYFGDPRVAPLMWVLSLGIVVSAFGNIGPVTWLKELDFRREFVVNMTCRLISFALNLALAFWLRNYWALAFGTIAGYSIGVAASYLAHPYRPRLGLRRWRELWSFSQWSLVQSVIAYAEAKVDEFILGGYTSARTLGLYTIGAEVGRLPTQELAQPANRVLFPTFSRIQNEPGRLAHAYLNAVSIVAALTVPAGVGLALVAPEAVHVFLGDKWLEATPFVALFAIYGSLRSLSGAAGTLLVAIGKPRLAALTTFTAFISSGVLAVGSLWMGYGAIGIASAKVAAAGVAIFGGWYLVISNTRVTRGAAAESLWRPCVASAAMTACLMFVPLPALSPVALLSLKVVIGATSYALAAAVLWRLAGRPDGAERMALQFAHAAAGRIIKFVARRRGATP